MLDTRELNCSKFYWSNCHKESLNIFTLFHNWKCDELLHQKLIRSESIVSKHLCRSEILIHRLNMMMNTESQMMFREDDSVDSINSQHNPVYPSLVYPIVPNEHSVSLWDIIGTFFSIIGKWGVTCLELWLKRIDR